MGTGLPASFSPCSCARFAYVTPCRPSFNKGFHFASSWFDPYTASLDSPLIPLLNKQHANGYAPFDEEELVPTCPPPENPSDAVTLNGLADLRNAASTYTSLNLFTK
jgi:hypothetical protein